MCILTCTYLHICSYIYILIYIALRCLGLGRHARCPVHHTHNPGMYVCIRICIQTCIHSRTYVCTDHLYIRMY